MNDTNNPERWQYIAAVDKRSEGYVRLTTPTEDGRFVGVAKVCAGTCSLEERARRGVLIAAAPELLKALKHAVLWLSEYPTGTHDKLISECKAAIAKAEEPC